MRSSQTTTAVSRTRTAMAPAVPQRMTRRCHSRGTLRAARPMTTALSPASTRSITMIDARAENHAGAKSSGVMAYGTRGSGAGSVSGDRLARQYPDDENNRYVRVEGDDDGNRWQNRGLHDASRRPLRRADASAFAQ